MRTVPAEIGGGLRSFLQTSSKDRGICEMATSPPPYTLCGVIYHMMRYTFTPSGLPYLTRGLTCAQDMVFQIILDGVCNTIPRLRSRLCICNQTSHTGSFTLTTSHGRTLTTDVQSQRMMQH